MSIYALAKTLFAAGLVLAAGATAAVTRDAWLPRPTPLAEAAGPHHHDHADAVTLSPQAVANLKLESRPVRLRPYWRTIEVPGTVVDRPGVTDRAVPTPAAGVVARVHVGPGDTVRPGAPLVTVRLVSDAARTAQAELFRATREQAQNRRERARLERAGGVIPEARFVELDFQHQQLADRARVHRLELQQHGLTAAQADAAADGRFAAEVEVAAPPRPGAGDPAAEVRELKVELGQQVQAGQPLATLADPGALAIEGRAFPPEAAQVAAAARHGWPVTAEFAGDEATAESLVIRTVGSAVDPASNTVPFYLPLTNPAHRYEKDGRSVRQWRYRTGQRVRLRVPVEKWDAVLVLPTAAVVREGGDAFVFRQNGDAFERRPVQVLHADRTAVVLKNDGGVAPGVWVAHTAAAALHRILKAQASGGHGHDHGHAH